MLHLTIGRSNPAFHAQYFSHMVTDQTRPLKENVTKLVTPAEYAKMKYVTRRTVYNWLKAGTIQGVSIGNRQFVRLA